MGLAISDPDGRYALPLEVVPANAAFPAVRSIVEREGVVGVVVGLARLPSGDEGEAARMARRLGERLRSALDVPVEYEDETLTSHAAEQAAGRDRPSDDVAASMILQQFLDRRNESAEGRPPHADA